MTVFLFFALTATEIDGAISYLKLGKVSASGPYSIPENIFIILKKVISNPLEILFNVSVSQGVVADCLKLASVIPVFKKGDHTSLCNYRPISLLSIFNKLLEKIMYMQSVSEFFGKTTLDNVLYNNQFGFRNKHSTARAILTIRQLTPF